MNVDDHAVPFALAALLAVVCDCSAGFASRRAKEAARDNESPLDESGSVAVSRWSADASQAMVVALTPLATGLAFAHGTPDEVGLAYVAAIVAGLFLFRWVLYSRLDSYSREGFLLSRVTWIAVAVNMGLAAMIQAIP